jgi:hypothetical protein
MSGNSTHTFDDRTKVHTWTYDDTTILTVATGRPDNRGRFMVTVKAYVGRQQLNHARIDLLSQDDRAKFHANTRTRVEQLNGAIPANAAKHAD